MRISWEETQVEEAGSFWQSYPNHDVQRGELPVWDLSHPGVLTFIPPQVQLGRTNVATDRISDRSFEQGSQSIPPVWLRYALSFIPPQVKTRRANIVTDCISDRAFEGSWLESLKLEDIQVLEDILRQDLNGWDSKLLPKRRRLSEPGATRGKLCSSWCKPCDCGTKQCSQEPHVLSLQELSTTAQLGQALLKRPVESDVDLGSLAELLQGKEVTNASEAEEDHWSDLSSSERPPTARRRWQPDRSKVCDDCLADLAPPRGKWLRFCFCPHRSDQRVAAPLHPWRTMPEPTKKPLSKARRARVRRGELPPLPKKVRRRRGPCPHGQSWSRCLRCGPRCGHGCLARKCPACNTCSHGLTRSACIVCTSCVHGGHRFSCKLCSGCPHGKLVEGCQECRPCPHGRLRWNCGSCCGCPHGRVKRWCATCNGCEHGRAMLSCGLCRGCPHGLIPRFCSRCEPCEHGRRRDHCAECRGCEHGQLASNCRFCSGCPHRRVRRFCVDCNPCPHGRRKQGCKECSSCPHGAIRDSCAKCKHCRHGRVVRFCRLCNGCAHGKLPRFCQICRVRPGGQKTRPKQCD